VHRALDEPNGLLAVGGSLSVDRLIAAYSSGIFPWFSDGDPILWWCPDPRMVLETGAVHVSKSLRRRLRRGDFDVSFDRAFAAVIRACAAPRGDESGTWLVPAMLHAYERLHAEGLAHSVEIWMDGALAGGLYGVALGRMFFGESMFTRRTDASKIALVAVATQLERWGFPIIDCQMRTEHLASLGATEIPRREFVRTVRKLVGEGGVPAPWRADDDLKSALASRHARTIELAGPAADRAQDRDG
jgi:leucyl/phenylalanyl-tRNA---protein transferase